ncbi:MAG: sugar ABC transporter ATP-binding protein [Clostridiales Family XIII bacterium]|jgi:ABC-type sugar transport system ATPase subunit|nr:sugar ABC transporter ATP-binding protein [Clostridiales Family XIII bacterium]
MDNEYRLQMKGITKQFPGVLALDDVDLEVRPGEVLAVIGENGAGKSTLMKILSGALVTEQGEVFLDGELIGPDKTPRERMELGIAIIYQELTNLDEMTVAENLFMGDIPLKGRVIKTVDYKALWARSKELLTRFNLPYDPFSLMKTLTVAEKQMVEILRAVSRNVKVLVMDEPTSSLSETEVAELYELIHELKDRGVAILYISHKLDEVFAIADRVQVMRDGKCVAVHNIGEVVTEQLVELMVGREIEDMYPKEEAEIGGVVLEAEHLACQIARDISFNVRRGEILGLFGLLGSGRTEAIEGMIGKLELEEGTVRLEGQEVSFANPIKAKDMGVAYVSADRKKEGLVLMQTVAANISVTMIDELVKGPVMDFKREAGLVEEWIGNLNIKTPSPYVATESLSGGNQQKIVIAKWLLTSPKVLILNEPTRGIDVGAKVEIYKIMEDLCKRGIAVVMISSELPESIGICDRIVVFKDGYVKGEFLRKDFTQKDILHVAVGADKQ